MLRTAVDDGVVDFGLLSCISCLAAWREHIDPARQQPPAALWRGRSLARAQLQRPEHADPDHSAQCSSVAARFSITYPSGRVALSGVSDGIRAQVREQGGRAGRRARVCTNL
eukprot:scaffold14856_cov60-Phaeocystis_antarctica.AAC.2